MVEKKALLMAWTDVAPDIEAEWGIWYDGLMRDCLKLPGFISARRFTVTEGKPKYLMVYDLAGIEVLSGEPYLNLRDREASLPQENFKVMTNGPAHLFPNCRCGLFEQIYPEKDDYHAPDTKYIDVVAHNVSPSQEDVFNSWYNMENMPVLIRIPGFVTARRFMSVNPNLPPRARLTLSGPNYSALYDIDTDVVLHGEAFTKQRFSPWSSWIRSRFPLQLRFVGRRVFPA